MLALARNMNFYKLVMMLKRYAHEAEKLQFEIRMKLHTGFKDYRAADNEHQRHSKTTGYIR
jgi:hypothetical protein